MNEWMASCWRACFWHASFVLSRRYFRSLASPFALFLSSRSGSAPRCSLWSCAPLGLRVCACGLRVCACGLWLWRVHISCCRWRAAATCSATCRAWALSTSAARASTPRSSCSRSSTSTPSASSTGTPQPESEMLLLVLFYFYSGSVLSDAAATSSPRTCCSPTRGTFCSATLAARKCSRRRRWRLTTAPTLAPRRRLLPLHLPRRRLPRHLSLRLPLRLPQPVCLVFRAIACFRSTWRRVRLGLGLRDGVGVALRTRSHSTTSSSSRVLICTLCVCYLAGAASVSGSGSGSGVAQAQAQTAFRSSFQGTAQYVSPEVLSSRTCYFRCLLLSSLFLLRVLSTVRVLLRKYKPAVCFARASSSRASPPVAGSHILAEHVYVLGM